VTPKYKLLPEFKNHEQVIELNDPSSGLKGFIAIHNTTLGPALGGTRIFPYESKLQALKDVLRLSHAMTYKSAIAGLKFGGGKGVIIADPKDKNIKKILRAYAEKISELKGRFHTGEDVGLSEDDVQYLLKFSPYFIGKSNQAGDPSPYAALSAFFCIKVALKNKFGSEKIKGRTFAIKGVGKTGGELARLIYKEGGNVIVSDIDQAKTKKLTLDMPKITVVPTSEIQKQVCDVYAPCAMGDDIKLSDVKNIKAAIICGTANNQLTTPEVAESLFKNGIIHIPDYIANAGGLIDVSAELWKGGFSKRRVLKTIKNLRPVLTKILSESKKTSKNPDVEASIIAEKNFTQHGHKLNIALKTIKAIFQYA
jgi:leucine dehydrogenase